MTVGSGRRLRVVPPLAGQLSLDLPGIPTAAELTQLLVASTVRSGPPAQERLEQAAGPRRLVSTRDVNRVGPGVAVRAPVAVWDGEDLVGVYVDESVARGDAVVLRRDDAGARHLRRTVDCLLLQVFTDSRAHPPVTPVDSMAASPVARTLSW